MAETYLAPSVEAATALIRRGHAGPLVMMNLLRFRQIADYAETPDLAPEAPISGAAAFESYVAATLPHLEAAGGAILFRGTGGPWLIGPGAARWDHVMLVRQTSVAAFLGWAEHEAYLDGIGHRTAALEDSRLLPVFEADWGGHG